MERQSKPSQEWDIILLRGGRDEHVFMHELTAPAQVALGTFLSKQCSDFELAFNAAVRNKEYLGLVRNLMQPSHQEWWPGWVVHWYIRPRQHPPASPPYKLTDFVLQIEKLERLA